ncbi:MAG TPA: NUDIX domain-containing protein [Sandaracinaceae bacterium LLY-WYZ-13_1]|nr:NUDIX domain-containing protein [Sandaracinaceae bacterium LLY-WYZ-13_1]
MADPLHCMRCGAPLVEKDLSSIRRQVCPEDGWVFYDNPTPVVAAIVEHRGDVILVRNHGWPEKWFGLVTGFLEKEETPEEGILRELDEELGLSGQVMSLVGLYPFAQRNELIIAYHVRAEGEVVLGDELEATKRIHPEKLRPWPFGTGHAVRDWLESRQASVQG